MDNIRLMEDITDEAHQPTCFFGVDGIPHPHLCTGISESKFPDAFSQIHM
jgi:hypothetical protein